MDSSLDLLSVFVTDMVGIAILVIILMARGWNLPARKHESRALLVMISASILNCGLDTYASFCDGKPGAFYYSALMISNTYLYLYNLIVGIGVIFLIVNHIEKKISKMEMIFFSILIAVEAVCLSINFFYPLVFYLDADNVYHRGTFYYLFVLAGFLLLLYGYAYYFVSKIKNPSLRYFPVFEFLLPILVSMCVQAWIYGISVQPVSFAVAFAGIVISLQNECIYLDKLTGVYNRYEFDKIIKSINGRRRYNIAAIMLDLNGFKAINDEFSHEEGDRALVAFANILMDIIKYEGTVIRFAGDEFIIILRRVTSEDVERYKKQIHDRITEYNETSGKPYELSVAIGGRIFEYGEDPNDIMTQIDTLMYKDKDDYYKDHERKR